MDRRRESIFVLRVHRVFQRDEFLARNSRRQEQFQCSVGWWNFGRDCAFNYALARGESLVVASAHFRLWMRATFDFHSGLDIVPEY
jgi:hypothetical protein